MIQISGGSQVKLYGGFFSRKIAWFGAAPDSSRYDFRISPYFTDKWAARRWFKTNVQPSQDYWSRILQNPEIAKR